jgi:hypothetical protein
MTNVERLAVKLEVDGLTISGITVGPNATPEAVAGEILRVLEDIELAKVEFFDY